MNVINVSILPVEKVNMNVTYWLLNIKEYTRIHIIVQKRSRCIIVKIVVVNINFILVYGNTLTPSKDNPNAGPYRIFMCFDAFGTLATATWGAIMLNFSVHGTETLALMLPISLVVGLKLYASLAWMQEVMQVPREQRFKVVLPGSEQIKPPILDSNTSVRALLF